VNNNGNVDVNSATGHHPTNAGRNAVNTQSSTGDCILRSNPLDAFDTRDVSFVSYSNNNVLINIILYEIDRSYTLLSEF